MGLAAVGFDDHPCPLPEEVGEEALSVDVDRGVAVGSRHPSVEQLREDQRLEIAAHVRRLSIFGPIGNEGELQRLQAAASLRVVDRQVDRLEVELPADCGAADRLPQGSEIDDAREVDQSAGQGRQSEPVPNLDLLRLRVTAPPASDPVDLAPGLDGNRYVDEARPVIPKAVQRRSTAVRNNGPISTGKHRRPQMRQPRNRAMANRVDPTVDSVERVLLRTLRSSTSGDALASQLIKRNYSALGGRLVCNPALRLRPLAFVVPLS